MIALQSIGLSVDGVTLLGPMSLTVRESETVAIRGANGSGKTTLLQLITGLHEPTTGNVTVAGAAPSLRDTGFRARVAGMIGLPPFASDLTLLEHATLIGATWGASVDDARDAAGSVFDELGLHRLVDRFPHELSSGQLQLAALALVLSRPYEVLVLDEPEQRLDAERLTRVIDCLNRRSRQGATLVVATHSARLSDELGARVVTLAKPA